MPTLEMIRDYVVGEFRGEFPTVDVDSRVDIDALTVGDDTPFYVTLPVARAGEVSSNGLSYDEVLVAAIQEQLIGKGGVMGHIKPEERDTAFPVEDVDWVGAKRQNGTLWGKAYVPPGAAREFIRRLKARGGQLATSIYGPYEKREVLGNGEYRMRGFRLESLDLAPADRAALQLGGKFAVTAQMTLEPNQEGEDMDKDEVIAELTANDIPQTIREQIVEDWQQENEGQKLVTELELERDDALKIIGTLQGEVEQYRTREFDAILDNKVEELIEWKVKGDEAQGKVDAFKRTLRARVVSELGDEEDAEKLDEAIAEVWTEMKPLAEIIRDALAGPSAIVSGKVRDSHKLEDTPAARAKARAATGI